MTIEKREPVRTDVLVIGGGGAGLRAALAATHAGARVAILSDTRVGRGSLTAISGGAYACTSPLDQADNVCGWQCHFEDTVTAGRYLCDQDLALEFTREIPHELPRLHESGVDYVEGAASWLAYCIDPGHYAARMYYGPNAIGTDLTFPMALDASRTNVAFHEGMVATRLLVDAERVVGALALTRDGHIQPFLAGATVLATGGAGHMYERSDNSPGATGDGCVLALDAGLPLQDMEFMQFYPTALYSGTPDVYYEVIVAGVNAPLLNCNGEDIRQLHGLEDPHSLTRDNLSIAIMREVVEGRGVEGGVRLDLSNVPAETLSAINPVLPGPAHRGHHSFVVAPTAHTHLGGVSINSQTETELRGLYAAGEVAGGVHGANRLGGNALSEVLVFGRIAGSQATHFAASHEPPRTDGGASADECARLSSLIGPEEEGVKHLRNEMKRAMSQKAGVVRDGASIDAALLRIAELRRALDHERAPGGRELQHLIKTRNLFATAELVCLSAHVRTESRGAHFRTDFPAENDVDWLQTVVLRKGTGGIMISKKPVGLPYLSP
ncbi:MAG: FAD-binding protein [Chloroflexota bacterium]